MADRGRHAAGAAAVRGGDVAWCPLSGHSHSDPDRYFQRLGLALRGRYTLVRRLGQGGQAAVYLGQDSKLGRQVAIKVLLPEVRAAFGSERFRLEVELVSRLSHPHIVKLFEADEVDGIPFYVMDYVEGESLQQRLQREGPLALKEALRIVSEVGDALQYAHEHETIHRDIKPGNILLSGSHALVTDFGIAKDTARLGGGTLTATGIALGTAPYMSPEQAGGEKRVDARTDVYSLAAVLYETLVGEPPFTGKSIQAILARVMVDAPRPMRTTRSGVPDHVERAILDALSKTPADRPASAKEFVSRLGGGSDARPVRLHRGLVFGAVALLVIGLIGWGAWNVVQRFRDGPATVDSLAVAVTTFDNLSPDTADVYLAKGLTEELTARLGQVDRLKVMSRRLPETPASDPKSIRSLGISYVVSGSVRRSAGRLRVTVELVNTASGIRIWGELYDREAADLLAIEEDIARQVASAVTGRLLPSEQVALATSPTTSPAAYEHYVRGLAHFSRRVEDGRAVIYALREFEAAVAIDTSFAQAYGRIGIGYCQPSFLNATFRGMPRDSALARASAAADRALRLDSTVVEAWLARGRVVATRDSQPRKSIEAFRRAVELDSNNAEALNFYGLAVLSHLGAVNDARSAFTRAVALEPIHPTYLANLAVATFAARRFHEARRLWDTALVVAPNVGILFSGRAMAHLALGDTGRAVEDARAAARLLPAAPWPQAALGLVDIARGDTSKAHRTAEQLAAERTTPDANDGLAVAALLSALGKHEQALSYLERIRPRQGFQMPLVLTYVFLDDLRSTPRFQRLVEDSHVP